MIRRGGFGVPGVHGSEQEDATVAIAIAIAIAKYHPGGVGAAAGRRTPRRLAFGHAAIMPDAHARHSGGRDLLPAQKA